MISILYFAPSKFYSALISCLMLLCFLMVLHKLAVVCTDCLVHVKCHVCCHFKLGLQVLECHFFCNLFNY